MRHSYGVDPDLTDEGAERLRAALAQLRAERRPLTAHRMFAAHDAEMQANLVESLRQRQDRWRNLSWSTRIVGLLCLVLAWLIAEPHSSVGGAEAVVLALGAVLFLTGVVSAFRAVSYRRTFGAVTLDGIAPETAQIIELNIERRRRGHSG